MKHSPASSAPPAFNPNAAASPASGLFGLPDDPHGAAVHVLGVPFDATTSFRKGTARGPEAIRAAGRQGGLDGHWTGRPYEGGIWMAPPDPRVAAWNEEASRAAEPVIAAGGAYSDPRLAKACAKVDALQVELNRWVEER